MPSKLENGDVLPALAVAGLAFANLPSDINDIKSATQQVACFIKGKKYQPTHNGQKSFSFIKGTLIQNLLDWVAVKYPQTAKKVADFDKTLFDTCIGKKLLTLFEMGGGRFKRWSARAMKRTTILGVIALSLLELPKIVKEISSGKDVREKFDKGLLQSGKSAFAIASTTAGIAYFGALGTKCGGNFGSLIGMGAGAVLGSYLPREICS